MQPRSGPSREKGRGSGGERRPRLDPSVAVIRNAVRDGLLQLEHLLAGSRSATRPGPEARMVLTACSGGPDSMALALAAAFAAPRRGWRHEAIVVDHGLQESSAEIARRVVRTLESHGIEASIRRIAVDAGRKGVEAAARDARYAALGEAARVKGAAAVLLGHTLDDQAETVLLGLARGSGPRSLAGMRPVRGVFLRPLLGVRRSDTVSACAAEGIEAWDDPMNADPAFARVRVRRRVLPVLERELGPGVAPALARTAEQLAEDSAVLDDLAASLYAAARTHPASDSPGTDSSPTVALDLAPLIAAPPALRRRALRLATLEAGAPGSDLTHEHIRAIDSLLPVLGRSKGPGGNPSSTGRTSLPGGLRARRAGMRLVLEPVGDRPSARGPVP